MSYLNQNNSDNEIKNSRNVARYSKVFRFIPGPWMNIKLTSNLFYDITCYPEEFREDIWAAMYRLLEENAKKLNFEHLIDDDCCCLKCLDFYLRKNLYLYNDYYEPKSGVSALEILPRFLWYKHEILKLYGVDWVVDTPLFNEEEDDIEEEDDEIDDSPDIKVTNSVSDSPFPANISQDFEKPEIGAKDITSSVLKDNDCENKKFQLLVLKELVNNEDTVLDHLNNEPVDRFSLALKDIQFRLTKHGILADPRTYRSKKGKDEAYDLTDPWLDDADDLANRIVDVSSESSNVNSDLDEDGNSDMDEIYEEREHLFSIDNFSEIEEDVVLFSEDGSRVIKEYEWAKPQILPNVFNPRSWAHNNRKYTLPPITILFFKTLEYALSFKKVQILQKNVYDKFEWVNVNEQDHILTLNDDGISAVKMLIKNVVRAAYNCFLHPYCCQEFENVQSLEIPQFLRYLKYVDIESPFKYGFIESNINLPDIIYSILNKVITPYAPPSEDCYRWWWLALTEYTIRVFFLVEYKVRSYLTDANSDSNKINESALNDSQKIVDSAEVVENSPVYFASSNKFSTCNKSIDAALMKFFDYKSAIEAMTHLVHAFNMRKFLALDLHNSSHFKLAGILLNNLDNLESVEFDSKMIENLLELSFVDFVKKIYKNNFTVLNKFLVFFETDEYNSINDERALINFDLSEINSKRKRDDFINESSDAGLYKTKKIRERNIVADLLSNLGLRSIESISGCPYVLPLRFGVALIKDNQGYVVICYLNHILSFLQVEIEIADIDPPIETVQFDKNKKFSNIIDLLDYLAEFDFIIEGRTRSMVYSGYDSKIKLYCLALLPLDFGTVSNSQKKLVYFDFIKTHTNSLKNRLSLLDIIILLYYLHGNNSGELNLNYAFNNNIVQNHFMSVGKDIEKGVSISICDSEKGWQKSFDRYMISQLNWLKVYQQHYLNLGSHL